MFQERRSVYRVTPTGQDRLEFVMCSEPGRPTAREIVDITIEGAGTRFPKEGTPALAVGDSVKLCISSPDLPRDVEVGATVAARSDSAENQCYRFKFEGRKLLERELPEDFYRIFNRRGAYRAAAFDGDPAVEVGLNALDTSPKRVTATARLRNISATGLGALIDSDADRDFTGVRSVEITVRLPDSDKTLRLAAWIRNREALEDRIYYGFLFDAKSTQNYLEQEEEIVDFVLCRFQEKLATALH